MKSTHEKAWAKVNLTLDVLAPRADGYHELRMVMQSISLCDDLYMELRPGGTMAVCNLPFVPGDERNSAVKAAQVFRRAAGLEEGVYIRIKKRIPVCAGLGGGSSDAAAVLRALNRLTNAGFSARQLRELALEVGSDVPFCVEGGTCLAEGRGEVLTPLTPLDACSVVVCMPHFSSSTKVLFGKIDSRASRCHPDTAGMEAALDSHVLPEVARRMYNVFEDVLEPRRRRSVNEIKSALLAAGALGAAMSGTGSAVYGLFDDSTKAEHALPELSPLCKRVFLASRTEKIIL